jgi:nitrogen fixation protein FixH
LTIEMRPPRPRKDAPFTLLVRVADPAGKAVSNASVHGSIVMSTADRGRQELDFSNAGDGLYRAETRVSFPGSWEVWLTATRGSDRVRQYTPFQVEP